MAQTDSIALRRSRRDLLRVLFPAGLGMALALAGDLTLYAVLPVYADQLGISLASIGLLLSANRMVRFASNPLVGLFSNRLRRRVLVLSGFGIGLVSTLLYLVQSAWVILAGRLLWGIAWSMMYIGVYCIILDITGEDDRGWGTGMLQTFYFLGIGATPVLGGFFSDWFGFRGGMLACAGVQGIGLLGALLFLPETYAAGDQKGSALPLHRQLVEVVLSMRTQTLGWLVRHREIILANYLYMATLFVGDGIIMSTLTLYLQQRYGELLPLIHAVVPVTVVSATLLAVRAIISGGLAPLTGQWSDRIGSRWTVAAWGAVVAIGGCVMLAVNGGFGAVVLGIILAAAGSGMLLAVLPAIISQTPGSQGSFAMGLMTTSGDIGSAMAPLIGYTMLKVISLNVLYLLSGGLLAVGVVASLLAGRGSIRERAAP